MKSAILFFGSYLAINIFFEQMLRLRHKFSCDNKINAGLRIDTGRRKKLFVAVKFYFNFILSVLY